MEGFLFQTSLIAAFIAGMVALFAPCCITFLLPAYLGSVFKEKEKILFMTLVFGLGIFIVLLPAVLGVAFISNLLFRYHDTIYFLAGLAMIIVAITAFLGIKLPMPHFTRNTVQGKTDVFSIFTLGIFSGITSACCAPVLVGILTLTFFSPSFFGALLIGGTYVLGMVVPLLFISAFLSGKMPKLALLRKSLGEFSFWGKRYHIITSNVIAGVIFFITGFLTLFLTLTGRLSMGQAAGFTRLIQNTGAFIDELVGGNILVNIVFLIIIVLIVYQVVRKIER